MREVSIYTQTTLKGMKRQNGVVSYVISTMTGKGEATLTDVRKITNATPNFAELDVLVDALGRINKPCELKIYTNSFYVSAGLQNWLPNWKANDWKTSKEEEISNVDLWKLLDELISQHNVTVLVGEKHQYKDWMLAECERKKNEKPW